LIIYTAELIETVLNRFEANMSALETMPVVTISTSAARRVAAILAKEPAGASLRIAVNGGGCSGFQYAFEISHAADADDFVVERDGAVLRIDPVSLQFMAGAEIDFVDDLIGQSFKVHNPNATASCGCGTSFAL
jgi:iron-sulfur cluster assembly accessory protein